MTFIIGMALPGSAWMATDTRQWNSQGTVDLPTGKLELLNGGWGAASGLVQWRDLAFKAIRHIPLRDFNAISSALCALRVSEALRTLLDQPSYAEEIDALGRLRAKLDIGATSTTVTGELGRLVCMYHTAAGYRGLLMDDMGTGTATNPGQFVCAPPPELSLAAVQEYLRSRNRRPPADWTEILRRVAELFLWAAERADRMSDTIEFVWMSPTGDRRLPLRRAADILADGNP